MADTHISTLLEFEEQSKRKTHPLKAYVSKYGYPVRVSSLGSLRYFAKFKKDNTGIKSEKKLSTVAGRLEFFENVDILISGGYANQSGASESPFKKLATFWHKQGVEITKFHYLVLYDVLVNPGLAEAQMTLLPMAEYIEGFSYIHRASKPTRMGLNHRREFSDPELKTDMLTWLSLLENILIASPDELRDTAKLLTQIYSYDKLTS